ncbi:MAG: diacylglycerol kinase family protein [bacterium]|nr:diacylglycerol kinase family protein [bacterium]
MKRAFEFTGRIRSFRYAFIGIGTMLKSQHNAWIHALATVGVVSAGWAWHITRIEWCFVVLAVMAVWAAEALNTAFEFLADATSPEFHPLISQNPRPPSLSQTTRGAVSMPSLTAVNHMRSRNASTWPHTATSRCRTKTDTVLPLRVTRCPSRTRIPTLTSLHTGFPRVLPGVGRQGTITPSPPSSNGNPAMAAVRASASGSVSANRSNSACRRPASNSKSLRDSPPRPGRSSTERRRCETVQTPPGHRRSVSILRWPFEMAEVPILRQTEQCAQSGIRADSATHAFSRSPARRACGWYASPGPYSPAKRHTADTAAARLSVADIPVP